MRKKAYQLIFISILLNIFFGLDYVVKAVPGDLPSPSQAHLCGYGSCEVGADKPTSTSSNKNPTCNNESTCGNYSECKNGFKSRNCTDSCGGSHPETIRCSSPQPKPVSKCWRRQVGKESFTYRWQVNKPDDDYKEVELDYNNCVLSDPFFCNVNDTPSNLDINKTCENVIKTNDDEGSSSCSMNNTTFYEYSCTERYIANYSPQLKNSSMIINANNNGLSQGFEYNIVLSVIKSCGGSFYNEVYNDAHGKAQAQVSRSQNDDEKNYFMEKQSTIEEYVKKYDETRKSYTSDLTLLLPNMIDIEGYLIANYRELNKDKKENHTYAFDIQMLDKRIQSNGCDKVNNTSKMVNDAYNYQACISNYINNKENYAQCIKSKNCSSEVCINECRKNVTTNAITNCQNYFPNNTNNNCTSNEKITINNVNYDVNPFSSNIIEIYLLTAPKSYLDSVGNVVKTIRNTETFTNSNNYIDGGHKFYLDNISVETDNTIGTQIKKLGFKGGSVINNSNCKFNIVENAKESYRIINPDNPFVSKERLNALKNSNWKNDTFDFTSITNSNIGVLYTFDLSRKDIVEIKKDNSNNNDAYLGTCSNAKNLTGTVKRMCDIINK